MPSSIALRLRQAKAKFYSNYRLDRKTRHLLVILDLKLEPLKLTKISTVICLILLMVQKSSKSPVEGKVGYPIIYDGFFVHPKRWFFTAESASEATLLLSSLNKSLVHW